MDWSNVGFFPIAPLASPEKASQSPWPPMPLRVSHSSSPPAELVGKQRHRVVWTGSGFGPPSAEWPKAWMSGSTQGDAIAKTIEPLLPLLGIGGDNGPGSGLTIQPLAAGTWNQAFTVSGTDSNSTRQFVFRVSKPAFPWFKTECEVATMQYVAMYTSIPVPRVYAYDSSADNPLGYEWILMEKIENASSLSEAQLEMSMDQKLKVSRTVATWVHELNALRFESIGGLYFSEGLDSDDEPKFRLGPPVHQTYMGDWRLEYPIPHGPFATPTELIRSLIACYQAEAQDARQRLRSQYDSLIGQIELLDSYLAKSPVSVITIDKVLRDVPDADKMIRLDKIRNELNADLESLPEIDQVAAEHDFIDWETSRYSLPEVLGENHNQFEEILKRCTESLEIVNILSDNPPNGPKSSPINGTEGFGQAAHTILFHWDISTQNVLIDNDTRKPTALIDWEQMYTLPLDFVSDAYPPLFWPDWGMHTSSRSHLAAWAGDPEEKPTSRQHEEMCWEKQLMRKAFRERLEELKSPWMGVVQSCLVRKQREKAREAKSEDGEDEACDEPSQLLQNFCETANDLVLEAARVVESMDQVGDWEITELLVECKRAAGLNLDDSSLVIAPVDECGTIDDVLGDE
ncbi:hypothetical protein ACHAQJ_009696 [Trichoderma viride]